ncbi:MAG: TIGR03761 family integrating conjugative element protein [Oleispira sp.]|nr:TIGR03761 family integrating conjugative element protein [Oleispira sp.]
MSTVYSNHAQVGALSSETSMELHSALSVNLWRGNKGLSVPGFFKTVDRLEISSARNDPYADYSLLLIEDAINKGLSTLDRLSDAAEQTGLSRSRISTNGCRSKSPVVVKLFIRARFAWRLVALVEQFDLFMVDLMDLNFKAKITRSVFEKQQSEALSAVRHVLSVAMKCAASGITRNDVSANNPKAVAAHKKFGLIPQEVMEGLVRAEFAPAILKASA